MARASYFRTFAVLAAALAASLLVLAALLPPALAAPEDRADATRKHVVVWPPQGDTVWPQIVNGQPASPGEYPAQGLLARRFGDSYYAWCGGTLLDERRFVTASHCTVSKGKPLPPGDFIVVLGEIDLNQIDENEIYPVAAVDVNADYNPARTRNDVTMLSLERAVDTSVLTPMRVVQSNEQSLWSPGVTARIVGWGDIQSGGPSSDVLLEADVPMRSDADCAGAYGNAFDPQTMVCAGNGNADTCQGDSGGPLLVPDAATAATDDFALAGITSWGYGCNSPDFPGVYTRIGDDPLNSWVRARIGAPAVGGITRPRKLTDNITIRFSEDMDPATLMDDPGAQPSTSETIKLFKGATEVLAKVSCTDASCKTVTLDPDNRLARSTRYTLRIEGVDNEDSLAVENSAHNNKLAEDFVKSFKTRR